MKEKRCCNGGCQTSFTRLLYEHTHRMGREDNDDKTNDLPRPSETREKQTRGVDFTEPRKKRFRHMCRRLEFLMPTSMPCRTKQGKDVFTENGAKNAPDESERK